MATRVISQPGVLPSHGCNIDHSPDLAAAGRRERPFLPNRYGMNQQEAGHSALGPPGCMRRPKPPRLLAGVILRERKPARCVWARAQCPWRKWLNVVE